MKWDNAKHCMDYKKSYEDLKVECLEKIGSCDDGVAIQGRFLAVVMYDKFIYSLNDLFCDKYAAFLQEMHLKLGWDYDFVRWNTLKGEVCLYVYYILDKDTKKSEYEPLIKFIFSLDQDKLNGVYTKKLFRRMDETLSSCLKETYQKWMRALDEYHGYLAGHFGKQIRMTDPRNDPEKYFLTHRIVVLD